MSTYVSVEISPATTTRPVVTSVSQATRPIGSSVRTASRIESEIWSAILSGWPSVTDSDVKRKLRSAIRPGRLPDGDRTADAQDGTVDRRPQQRLVQRRQSAGRLRPQQRLDQRQRALQVGVDDARRLVRERGAGGGRLPLRGVGEAGALPDEAADAARL